MLGCMFMLSATSVQAMEATSEVTTQVNETTQITTEVGTEITTTEVATTQKATESAKKTEKKKKKVKKTGWVKKNGKKYYYVKGKKVTGWKKIKGKKYYFNKKGVLQTNKMISYNKYVNKKGQLIDKKEIYANGKPALKKLKATLQTQLKSYSGTWCVYVKNLDTNEYMLINNRAMTTASIIKLFNMGAVYDRIEKKKLTANSDINSNLQSMITVSSNDAYNVLLNRLGNGNTLSGISIVNQFCKKNGYTDTVCGGTLLPSYFPQCHSGWGQITARDCGHILEDIYRGTLVSKSASKKMLNLLKAQQRKGKIPAGLPAGVKSANKTGEYNLIQHDAAIVFSKKADYVIVVLSDGDTAGISHIQAISRTTYNYFN